MAELTVDTSSYPKPQAPVNPLDVAGKLGQLQMIPGQLQQQQQQIQSGALGINQQKLDQANQALTYLTRGMNSLGPNPTKEGLMKIGQNIVNMGLAPPSMLQEMTKQIPDDPTKMPAFVDQLNTQAAQHGEMINHFRGQVRNDNTGNNQVITQVPGSPNYPPRNIGQIANQAPPTSETIDNNPGSPTYGQKQTIGSVPSPGIVPTNRLSAVPPRPDVSAAPQLVSNKNQSRLGQNGSFPTALPPGVGEAETVAGGSSGTQLAQALNRAKDFQTEVYPLSQALPALESLGTKGTGPGTETINQIKSFVLSNVPGVKESDFKGTVKDFDLARKYLTQFVTTNGATGTNDKLAAAFAGNPSVSISNAAAVDVAKSALSLRRMQHAVDQEFVAQNLPASQYSRWVAKRMQDTDPRAFGVDLMSKEKKAKLFEQIKKNPTEAQRFEDSLNLAQNLGFLTPHK